MGCQQNRSVDSTIDLLCISNQADFFSSFPQRLEGPTFFVASILTTRSIKSGSGLNIGLPFFLSICLQHRAVLYLDFGA